MHVHEQAMTTPKYAQPTSNVVIVGGPEMAWYADTKTQKNHECSKKTFSILRGNGENSLRSHQWNVATDLRIQTQSVSKRNTLPES